MSQISNNNKRIAKNTILLYFRMIFVMLVTLFTSRVILKSLGVVDFGIYNVVGGIVTMMGVLNGAMSASTTRYLTFEIGRGDEEQLKKTFSVCFSIYILLCLIFLFIAEIVGTWFINTQLVIPNERITAANYVYQFSIISTIFSLLGNPYNAIIIAHEKMSIYAYISVFEVTMKLLIAYLLYITYIDKLIVYGFLMLLTHFFVISVYYFYCKKHYPECKYHFYKDKELFSKLFSYSGWSLFGSVSGMVKGHGLNILLNMFFSPAVNAARGIAYQVNVAITQFSNNFYTAVKPQITKYYAQNDLDNMFLLVFRSAKMSFYLLLVLSLPVLVETPNIVQLWLDQVPEYVVIFTRYIIIISIVDAMATPLMTTAHATGRIALYQSTVGTATIMNIPISYLFLHYGAEPITVFQVSLVISVLCLFMRLWIVKRLVNFPFGKYIVQVLLVNFMVASVALALPVLYHIYFTDDIWDTLINCFISFVSAIITIYLIGLKDEERKYIKNFIYSKIKRNSINGK